ncbi:MAG: hypothetical protein DHS20C15_31950 [Planctomycetota bacterium]|nr:MAG: hypothetical protein DHS20C15_31950 [Planctomycetota bacterium]
MPPASARAARCAAGLTALGCLLVFLFLSADYGPSWDQVAGEYPYGEQVLESWRQGDPSLAHSAAREHPPQLLREPHPDFSAKSFPWFQVCEVGAVLSAISCRVFFQQLDWLTAFQAHHLPAPLTLALLVYVLVAFMARRAGLLVGVLAGVLLAFMPRVFAHGHHNLKDIPEMAFYTFAVLAGYRAMESGRGRWVLLAGACSGLALAQKPNALFLPPQLLLGAGVLALWRLRRRERLRFPRPLVLVLACATGWASYVLFTPGLWPDLIDGVRSELRFVLGVGSVLFDERGDLRGELRVLHVPALSTHALLHVVWTTPLVLLALAPVGLFARRVSPELRFWLLLAVAVPVGRTLIPGMRNFGGVRHLIEFAPPLAALAALGAGAVLERVAAQRRVVVFAGAAALAGSVALPSLRAHPFAITWFNALPGGLAGAQATGLDDATDYWAVSYWQGLDRINALAAPGDALLVPIAGGVVQSAAPVKLRGDIQLVDTDTPSVDGVLWVMHVTRESWYDAFVEQLDRESQPADSIEVDGVPILVIHRVDAGAPAQAALHDWQAGRAASELLDRQRRAVHRLQAWLRAHPEANRAIGPAPPKLDAASVEKWAARARKALPKGLHHVLDDAVTLLFEQHRAR